MLQQAKTKMIRLLIVFINKIYHKILLIITTNILDNIVIMKFSLNYKMNLIIPIKIKVVTHSTNINRNSQV